MSGCVRIWSLTKANPPQSCKGIPLTLQVCPVLEKQYQVSLLMFSISLFTRPRGRNNTLQQMLLRMEVLFF